MKLLSIGFSFIPTIDYRTFDSGFFIVLVVLFIVLPLADLTPGHGITVGAYAMLFHETAYAAYQLQGIILPENLRPRNLYAILKIWK